VSAWLNDQGVTIGEDKNTVGLTPVEWNDLVARVKRGELREDAMRDAPPSTTVKSS